jgi:glutaredoxin-like YruB-family protein
MITRKYIIPVLALCLVFLSWSTAGADIYKWVDQNGIVHFADAPPGKNGQAKDLESMPTVPPSQTAARNMSLQSEGKSDPAQPPPEEPVSEPKPVRNAKVELYVTSWCKYCTMARNFLRSKNVPFVEYDIEKDNQAAKRRESLEKRSGVPLVVINDTVILGFSEAAYTRALNLP